MSDDNRTPEGPAEDAEASYSELVLTDEQRELVAFFARFGAEKLGISPVPFRGFLWKAARDWQQRNKNRVAALEDLTPEDRFRHTEEMMDLFLDRLGKAFPSIGEEDLEQLRRDGLALYRDTFNRRQ